MPIPANANTVVVQGYWWDEQTGGGVNASLTFSPVPLSGSAPTPNLTDLVSYGWIKTRVFSVTPDPATGYYAVALIANDDPDLTAFGGWKVQPDGEDPFTISVPYNTATKTVTAQMAAAVPGLTQGQSVQALWLTESAVITSTPPVPPSSYLTATQTASAIATALAGLSSGGASAFTQRTTAATANTTAADNEIVPANTSGGTFTITGPSSGKPFGVRWRTGTAAPTVAAPSGYTINGAASITMGLAPSSSQGELVTWAAVGTDYQPFGGFKPQSALDQRNGAILNTHLLAWVNSQAFSLLPSRVDSVGTTSGSATVTDTAITALDQGRPISGAGIPAGSFVGTVTAGTSFLLSSSATSQVNVNATATASGVSATLLSAARDSNGAIVLAVVTWPDGSSGKFTTTTASSAFPGAVDAYNVTYIPSGGTTRTVTQAAVTRDSNGAVVAQPALGVA